MRHTLPMALLALTVLWVGCTSSGARSTSDPRVQSFLMQTAPELPVDGTWVGRPSPLAGLRGRVVYLQFAFPT